MNPSEPDPPSPKGPLDVIVEANAKGIIASSESHGTETPGYVSGAADAARETALIVLILWGILTTLNMETHLIAVCSILVVGWTIWKFGRAAWLGWTRLERLHRLVAEERWEIEHHRQKEREELAVLYAAKGFSGKLLEDVVDVLMADGDRLLRVMIEEELGLSLQVYEHPLQQGLGAAAGVLSAGVVCLLGIWLLPAYGIYAAAAFVIGSAAGISAYLEKNHAVPAIVWNLGIASGAFCSIRFLLDWVLMKG